MIEIKDLNTLQPTQYYGKYAFHRDDLFIVNDASGSKVRVAIALCEEAIKTGKTELVLSTSSSSHMPWIYSKVAQLYNLKIISFTPILKDPKPEIKAAMTQPNIEFKWAEMAWPIICKSRADKYCAENDKALRVPVDGNCEYAHKFGRIQAELFDKEIGFNKFKRLLLPVGSGANAYGILQYLQQTNNTIPAIILQTGKETKEFITSSGYEHLEYIITQPSYGKRVKVNKPLLLDEVYEAKCFKYMQPGDLFWVIGGPVNVK